MFEDIIKGAKILYEFAVENPYATIGIFAFIIVFAVVMKIVNSKKKGDIN